MKISATYDNNDIYGCISYLSQLLSEHPHLATKLNHSAWMDCFANIKNNEGIDAAVEFINRSLSAYSPAIFTLSSGGSNNNHPVTEDAHFYRTASPRQQ